jgi:hypothetical protein
MGDVTRTCCRWQPGQPPIIALQATHTEDYIILTIRDDGLGLTELQQRQLFGLFQCLHTHVEGTGVGLYMVKRMVVNAGGTITVQSQPDQGTTLTVTFLNLRFFRVLFYFMLKLSSVLLVDDNKTPTFLNKLLVDTLGITEQVLVAENGQEALRLLTPGQPALALILLDMNMPVMNGLAFLES